MDSYERTLRALACFSEEVTLCFKNYTPAFVNFMIENNSTKIIHEYSRRGPIGRLAKRGLAKMDFDRGNQIFFNEPFPPLLEGATVLERELDRLRDGIRLWGFRTDKDREGTIVEEFFKKNPLESMIYQFEIGLVRDEEQKRWRPLFVGYEINDLLQEKWALSGEIRNHPDIKSFWEKNGQKEETYLTRGTKEEIEELGRKLLGPKSVEALVA